jgi:hypothetical protein
MFANSMMQQGANGAAVSPGMQQNGTVSDSGGAQTNGNIAAEADGEAAEVNGEEPENLPAKIMDKTNQDIVRLIGQHLKTVGLEYVVNKILLLLTLEFLWSFIIVCFSSQSHS